MMEKIVDLLDIRENGSKLNVAGTITTIIAVLTGLATLLNEVIIPSLQTMLGMLGTS